MKKRLGTIITIAIIAMVVGIAIADHIGMAIAMGLGIFLVGTPLALVSASITGALGVVLGIFVLPRIQTWIGSLMARPSQVTAAAYTAATAAPVQPPVTPAAP